MNKTAKYFFRFFGLVLSNRYKININGAENLKQKGPFLVLPNHPGLIDPQLLGPILLKFEDMSPIASEKYYDHKLFGKFVKWMGAISMPNLDMNDLSKIANVNQSINIIIKELNNGRNLVIYPSGGTYSQGFESIIGKKTAYRVVSQLPENVRIIGVRTLGLWGSMLTKAYTGKYPDLLKMYLKGIYYFILNGFFFLPKREVSITFEDLTDKLITRNNGKIVMKYPNLNDFNKYLEKFYNKYGEEEIKYVKHYWFYNDVKNKIKPTDFQGSLKSKKKEGLLDFTGIDKNIINSIIEKIAYIKSINPEKISLNSNLVLDLLFDSLDLAEIKLYILNNYENAKNISISDLKTVGDIVYMACGK